MHGEESLLTNTTLWYGIAVVIFVAGMFLGARRPIAALLDGAIAKIAAELEEAKRLRAEAAATLEEYKRKQVEAMREAQDIVAKAKDDAERLQKESEAELKAMLAHQEQLALDRINLVRDEAMAEVRKFVIEETMRDLRGKLAKHTATPDSAKMIDQIIADLPKLLKNKIA